jgi:Ca2+-binding RTX toxin-like protein
MTFTTGWSTLGGATTSVTTPNSGEAGTQQSVAIVADGSAFANDVPLSFVFYVEVATASLYVQRVTSDTGAPAGNRVLIATGVDVTLDAAGNPPPISAIGNGSTLAVTWATNGSPQDIKFAVFSPGTNSILATGTVDVAAQNCTHPTIALMEGNAFVIAYERAFSVTDHDILARVYNSGGTPLTGNLIIEGSAGTFDEFPSVVGLASGGFAVSFDRLNTGTGSSALYEGIYDVVGNVVTPVAVVDSVGTVNRGVHYASHQYINVLGQFSDLTMRFWEDSQVSGSITDTDVRGFRTDGVTSGAFLASITSGNNAVGGAALSFDGYAAVVNTRTFSPTDLDTRVTVVAPDGTLITTDIAVAATGTADERGGAVAWIDGSSFRVVWNNDVALGGDPDAGIGTRLFTVTRTITGDGANDSILAPDADSINDVIDGGAGNDTIRAGGGVDIVNGGDGDDVIVTRGRATIDAGNGDDVVQLDGIAVSATGGAGTDRLILNLTSHAGGVGINLTNMWGGGTGTISQIGGGESGTVTAFETLGIINGSGWNDTIILGANAPSQLAPSGVFGGDGDDVIIGGSGNDRLFGGNGSDTLSGGNGDDFLSDPDTGTLIGGFGHDTYQVGSRLHSIVELAGQGVDTIISLVNTYVLPANVEILNFSGVTNVLGIGNSGDNTLNGVANSRDDLYGGAGNDTLNDGGGAIGFEDTLIGGTGNDIYLVGVRGSSTIELAGEGIDEVRTDYSIFALQANIENLTATGNGTHGALVGNSLNNLITGGTGTDDLFGRDGDDTLEGGTGAANTLLGQAGSDVYIVRAVGDTIIEAAGEGQDFVNCYTASFTLSDNLENLTFLGDPALDRIGVGNNQSNNIRGAGGNDSLSGLGGGDTLIGGAGSDILQGGSGFDQFTYLGNETGLDRILDFTSGEDAIQISLNGFGITGSIDFVSGGTPVATSTNTTILYDTNSSIISIDVDGSGAGLAIQLAQLNVGQGLSIGDFVFGIF